MFGKKFLGILSFCSILNCADAVKLDCAKDGERLHSKLADVLPNLSEQNCRDILAQISKKTFVDYYDFQEASPLVGVVGNHDWAGLVNPGLSRYIIHNKVMIPLKHSVNAATKSDGAVLRININCLLVTQYCGHVRNVDFCKCRQYKAQNEVVPYLHTEDSEYRVMKRYSASDRKYRKEKKRFQLSLRDKSSSCSIATRDR